MTAVIQRTLSAAVRVDGEVVGSAGRGILVLAGFDVEDTKAEADIIAKKTAGIRIFPDENGKMGASLSDIGGEILLVPNFTLAASCRNGRRPDFTGCMNPESAKVLFEYFTECLRMTGIPVETGIFGADMKIEAVCDGPVTLILRSSDYTGRAK